jgi:hypothetical protein
MARPENPLIALIDDINTTQEITRTNARQLIDLLAKRDLESKQFAEIVKATIRTQKYLKELRKLAHKVKV